MNPHNRKSIRVKNHDYTQAKSYFVTIRTNEYNQLFGEIVDGHVKLNKYGKIVRDEWLKTADVRPYVSLDEYVVMPDHFHAIIHIYDHDFVGATRRVAPTQTPHGPEPQSLGSIIGQFKSIVTKQIRKLSGLPERIIWQRNYHERIIRSDELDKTRRYIIDNPSHDRIPGLQLHHTH